MSTAPFLESVDPGDLLLDDNIRASTVLDPDDVASIREHGVLLPVVAYRTASGRLRVEDGHKRTLGAIEAGRSPIPVLVAGDEGTEEAARVARRLRQWDANERRAGLNNADRVKFVQEMLDLGVTAQAISEKARIPQAQVDAAAAVAGSRLATAAAGRYEFLTLEQSAVLAAYEDDTEAVTALVAAAREGEGRFGYMVQRVRDEAPARAARRRLLAELEAAGTQVAGEQPEGGQRLSSLADPDGEPLTVEGHQECPGHAAYLIRGWVTVPATGAEDSADPGDDEDSPDGETYDAEDVYGWVPMYFCTDPAGNGHQAYATPGPGQAQAPEPGSEAAAEAAAAAAAEADQAREERTRVRTNNSEWRTAQTVRRRWLREFVQGLLDRKTKAQPLPKGALRYILECIAQGDRNLARAMEGGHEFGAGLFGISRPERAAWRDYGAAAAFGSATEARGQVIVLGLALAACEATLDVHTWRNPGEDDRRYLTALASWGYALSDVEKLVTGSGRKS